MLDANREGSERTPHADARWRLCLLDDFALFDPSGAAVAVKPRKGRALIAWLVLVQPHRASRERLTALLWSDRAGEQARASLRQCLYDVKSISEGDEALLAADTETVSLRRDGLVTDLEEIVALARTGDLHPLGAKLDLVHSGLLTDLDHLDPAFDDWLALERLRRLGDLFEASAMAAERALREGEFALARDILTRLQQIDPADESIAQLGMRADAAAGDYAALRRRYQRLADHLRHELDTAPSTDTSRLLEALTSARSAEQSAVDTLPAKVRNPSAPPLASASFIRPVARLAASVFALAMMLGGLSSDSARPPVQASTTQIRPRAQAVSLAVLPFDNLSPGEEDDYFGAGVAEEIRTQLSQAGGLRVAGRSSTELFGPGGRADEARRRLGVSHLLEGSFRLDRERLRLNVRLVNTQNGMQVWGQRFDRRLDDVFTVQDEIGAAVASRLRGSFFRASDWRRAQRTTPEVFDRYLAASAVVEHDDTSASGSEAERLLREALARDPDYAPAHALLGDVLRRLEERRPHGPQLADPAGRQRIQTHFRRAIQLDPRLPEAYVGLGLVDLVEHPERTLALARHALSIDPGYYMGWISLGWAQNRLCRPDLAIESYRRATVIEPLLPAPHGYWIGWAAGMGRYQEAEQVMSAFLRRVPDPKRAEGMRAYIALERGDLSSSLVHLDRLLRMDPDAETGADQAAAWRALGYAERAAAMLQPVERESLGAYWRHDFQAAARQHRRLRHENWDDLRIIAINKAMVRLGRHGELLRYFDERWGSVEQFEQRHRCKLQFQAPPIVMAMRAMGRNGEADRLVTLALRRVRQAEAAGYNSNERPAVHAAILILAGHREPALDRLERAVATGWIEQWMPLVDLSEALWDPVRDHPRFRAVLARLEQIRVRERRELASAGVPLNRLKNQR